MKGRAASKHSVLCVFAHPDDESFCCAGTIARYRREGVPFHVLTFTRGQAGKPAAPVSLIDSIGMLRESELRAAASVLDVASVRVLDYMDGKLDTVPQEELIEHVKDALDETGADTIITFGPEGLTKHDDHKTAHRVTLLAAEEYARKLRVFLVALEPDDSNGVTGPEAQPTHRIDVTGFRGKKLAALACHASQEDARRLFTTIAEKEQDEELFHQAYPPARCDDPSTDLFGGDPERHDHEWMRFARTG
jgi:N-acetylglucosamine malate deacetylase 2